MCIRDRLYVLIALVLTGMVPYDRLDVGDPLAFAFLQARLDPAWAARLSAMIAVSAIVAMTSVLLVFQMGQPRIWMSMSRDGLLPSRFARIHPKYRTPAFSTVVTGFVVAVPALFMNLSEVTDLSSIGTLFAFVLVCGGVIRLQQHPPADYRPRFRLPYFDSRWWVVGLYIATWAGLLAWNTEGLSRFFSFAGNPLERLPLLVFLAGSTAVCIGAFRGRWSLIPVLGLLTCFYLMSEVHYASWLRFLIWLAVGLVVYFLYSRHHSRLHRP
jgi:amino acid transporter